MTEIVPRGTGATDPGGRLPEPRGAGFDADFYDDLGGALDEAWRLLGRGAADRKSGFHTGQLATVGADGGPRARTVVLRGADRAGPLLRVHTDRRSTKAGEIAAEPRVELCLYDPRAAIQIRVRGRARIEAEGAAADAAWAASRPGSRVCYRSAWAPGAPLPRPGAADPGEEDRQPADPDAGREAFAAILIAPDRLEWLYLAARGHRRALFTAEDGWRGRWIAP